MLFFTWMEAFCSLSLRFWSLDV